MAKMCKKCHKYVDETEMVCPFCSEPFGLIEYIDPLQEEKVKTGKVNFSAVMGFIFSFFTLSVIGGILALFFCVKGILESRYYTNHRGRGLAVAGIIIGVTSIILFVMLQLGLIFLSKSWEPIPDESSFFFFLKPFSSCGTI